MSKLFNSASFVEAIDPANIELVTPRALTWRPLDASVSIELSSTSIANPIPLLLTVIVIALSSEANSTSLASMLVVLVPSDSVN